MKTIQQADKYKYIVVLIDGITMIDDGMTRDEITPKMMAKTASWPNGVVN